MEIALFSLLKIHGTQFSLEYIGPKALLLLLPKNLPMFKRFMNLELLLPKYQQSLFLEL